MIWHKIKNKKPAATEKGFWDGKRSDLILVSTLYEKIHIARMYEGILDGSEFCNFYDENNDAEIENVVQWTEIELPF